MKTKKIVVMSLVATLCLGTTGISFARGGSMGGGFTGNRGSSFGPSGSNFGGRGAIHSSGQEMNGPSGGHGDQSQIRLRDDIGEHRPGVPGDAGNQLGHRNGNQGEPAGAEAGNQQGYHNGNQGDGGGVATGDRQRDNIRLRDDINGDHTGQQYGPNNNPGSGLAAVPATPADPGTPGEAATPATPATPAVPAGN